MTTTERTHIGLSEEALWRGYGLSWDEDTAPAEFTRPQLLPAVANVSGFVAIERPFDYTEWVGHSDEPDTMHGGRRDSYDLLRRPLCVRRS